MSQLDMFICKFMARCVNSILYLYKIYQKRDAEVWTYHCSTYIEYIYLSQSCIDSFMLISLNLMGSNIRNEVDKTFVKTKLTDM